jgi:hypothetical protein
VETTEGKRSEKANLTLRLAIARSGFTDTGTFVEIIDPALAATRLRET